MAKSAKISISLPNDLLRSVEQSRMGGNESRSDFFRRAAESLLRQEQERTTVERYVQGYLTDPESEVEEAWAELGKARLAEVEW